MNHPVFVFYTRPNCHNKFLEFIDQLPLKDKAKLLTMIYQVQEHRIQISLQMEWVKKIDSDIFEIRSKVSSNIQRALYFHVSNNRYVITHGFTKKTQKTPKSEIKRAKTIKKEFEEEVKHANH